MVSIRQLGEGIFEIALNRPEKKNALSIELRDAVAGAFEALAAKDACKAVVLAGRGDAFCAGMDFTQFGGDRRNRENLLRSTSRLFGSILSFPMPIVAAIHGAAVGGGFVLALTCDVRLASNSAYFGFFEVRRGIPAPYDVARLFLSEETAREICESGRKIDAAEALRLGLVERLCPPDKLVRECSDRARTAVRSRPEALGGVFAAEFDALKSHLFPGEKT